MVQIGRIQAEQHKIGRCFENEHFFEVAVGVAVNMNPLSFDENNFIATVPVHIIDREPLHCQFKKPAFPYDRLLNGAQRPFAGGLVTGDVAALDGAATVVSLGVGATTGATLTAVALASGWAAGGGAGEALGSGLSAGAANTVVALLWAAVAGFKTFSLIRLAKVSM